MIRLKTKACDVGILGSNDRIDQAIILDDATFIPRVAVSEGDLKAPTDEATDERKPESEKERYTLQVNVKCTAVIGDKVCPVCKDTTPKMDTNSDTHRHRVHKSDKNEHNNEKTELPAGRKEPEHEITRTSREIT